MIRFLTHLLALLFLGMLCSACAVTHNYGPYMGKVVDKETNAPIEGAVVFMSFTASKATLAGSAPTGYYDAIEVLTDSDGEFLLDPDRNWRTSGMWESWKDGQVIIFKPGYGAYPGHRGTEPLFIPNGTLPENQHVTIKLPKLESREERIRNLGYAAYNSIEVPENKQEIIQKLYLQERGLIGLSVD